MKKIFRWLTGQKKSIRIFVVVGLLVLPFLTQIDWKIPQNTWAAIPLSGKWIIIDPGHGGPDGGASSPNGWLKEEGIALNTSLYLRDYLQEAGAFVIMTRETDTDLAQPETRGLSKRKTEDLVERIQLIHQQNADALISIHLNSIPSNRWRGAQTFYNPTREENKKLATSIQSEMIRNLENTNRTPKQKGDVYILRHSAIPTTLVEVGFLSNPDEARLLNSVEYQKKVATAIYYGILRYCLGHEPSPL
jgi:N-acetylmuramoyl-L-alanine amidase